MRAFVAIELPPTVKDELARRAGELKKDLPPARWVPAANYHLTLRFLGEITDSRAEAVAARLQEVFGERRRFDLQLRGGGCFPARRPARVAWVGLAEAPDLDRLQSAVEAVCGEGPGRAPQRPFRPHLTLARCRRPWPRAAVERWAEAFADDVGGAFEVDRGLLMRSRLFPDGARHTPLRSLPLSAGAGGAA